MIMLGDSAVGKSSILNLYSGEEFNENHNPTVGIDFVNGNHTLKDGNVVKLKIWDTAGQERFHNITQTFYKKADGIVLIYDITDKRTFEGIKRWIENIRQHAKENVPIILLGNKTDLTEQREVSAQ